MQYSDTSNEQGLVQLARSYVKADSDTFSDNLVRQYLNVAMDEYASMALKASHTWQFDDTEYDDFPEATANLVLNQKDYEFDESFLNVRRVEIQDTTGGVWRVLPSVDEYDYKGVSITEREQTNGKPRRYYLKGQSIILDPKPDASVTGGLKVYYERNVKKFTGTAGQKPGIPSLHHPWLAKHAAYNFAVRENLQNRNELLAMVDRQREEIEDDLSRRDKTRRPQLTVKPTLSK